tara:strand:- start:1227 stop:1430 length:204 start_codon:yes stop_codon:yes gene_type:complete
LLLKQELAASNPVRCCNLTNHLKPVPVGKEKGDNEALTILNRIWAQDAGPSSFKLDFGWGKLYTGPW